MSPAKDSFSNGLRHRAEELLKALKPEVGGQNSEVRERKSEVGGTSDLRSPSSDSRMLQELQVQQIELKMQNEELKKIHGEADAAAEKYADLYDFAPAGYFTLNSHGDILQTNLAGAALLESERAHLQGKRFGIFVAEADLPAFNAFLKQVFAAQVRQTCEVEMASKGASRLIVQIEGILSRGGQQCCIVIEDVSAFRQAEEDLLESETRFKALHNATFGGIAIHDKGTILICNLGLSEITGYSVEELEGMDGLLLIAEQARKVVTNNISSGYEKPYEAIGVRKDGEEYPLRLEARNIPYKGKDVRVVEFRDITEQRELESQLRQAQKMESISRLAGGVAHDFNNVLMGMMGYIELCRDQVGSDPAALEYLDAISKGAERSATITRQLLGFARRQAVQPKVLDLNDAIDGMLKFLRRAIGEDVEMNWSPGSGAMTVKIDPSQIDQILVNIAVNARDAIGGVGALTIETGTAVIDEAYCATHEGAVAGDYVRLTVSDTGCGMDHDTIAHIFEPFFTTKGVGKGTGMGMATVYGIVKQNNGFVYVYSEPDKGTSFKIYIPRLRVADAAPVPAVSQVPPPRGTETVLIAEAENSIRITSKAFLEALGYTVLTAENPAEALRLVGEHAGKIQLLLSDVIMPGMSGPDLAKHLVEPYPEMKCIFMSGFTAEVMAERGVLEKDVEFLSKPFGRDELARKVRDVLDRA